MTRASLKVDYFNDIFASDDDPWNLASSAYEAAKFAHTRNVLADRRYARGLEIGCAHGVLTAQLAPLCETLLAIDISTRALAKAQARLGERPDVTFVRAAFPQEHPDDGTFDLVILSEVAYYWSSDDLKRSGGWLREHVAQDGRIILVHFTGDTDYPHSGDDAVRILWSEMDADCDIELSERQASYRLDLWRRR